MRALKRRDPKTHREIERLFDVIETTPDMGYELRDEWEGCMAVHCGRDRYRVIWEPLPPEEDYDGITDEIIPVVILRVGPKTDSAGRTIYEDGRPPTG
jgi:hypothetical protein